MDGEMLQEEKAKAVEGTPATHPKDQNMLKYAMVASRAVHDAGACALATFGTILARQNIAKDRLAALKKVVDAKEALKQKEAFYLLGTDPTTQLPYINGKNEAIREAQLVVLTKDERAAVNAAEVALAEAESKEDVSTDDMDLHIAMLYCHASHAFPEFQIGGTIPEIKLPAEDPTKAKLVPAATEQPPQQ